VSSAGFANTARAESTLVDTPDPTVDLVERAVAQTAVVIAAIRPDQHGRPTPCAEWDVQSLVAHVITQDLPNFATSARGEMPDWQAPVGEIGDDWATQFSSLAEPLMDIWRISDLDRPVPGPGGELPLRVRADQQIAEFAMHAWDLREATGQEVALDTELAEHALAWSRQMLRPEYRGPDRAFGLEIPVDADAAAYDRLAGWFGRDPAWVANRL